MKVSILGATGKMGGFVVKASLQEGCLISNKVSSRDNVANLFNDTDCIIDFSCPMATEAMLRFSKEHQKNVPIVIGTTGLSKLHSDLMKDCSSNTAVFYAANMSFLVAIMNMMVYALGKLLGPSYDVEISETHHRLKKDAPSGTALMLGKSIAKARGDNFNDVASFVRYGVIEPRRKGEIGFNVQRCGNVIGTHTVEFIGDYEDLEFRHHAHSREIFAKGAVKAAFWLIKQQRGMYDMNSFTKDLIVPIVKSLYKDFFAKKL